MQRRPAGLRHGRLFGFYGTTGEILQRNMNARLPATTVQCVKVALATPPLNGPAGQTVPIAGSNQIPIFGRYVSE